MELGHIAMLAITLREPHLPWSNRYASSEVMFLTGASARAAGRCERYKSMTRQLVTSRPAKTRCGVKLAIAREFNIIGAELPARLHVATD